MDEKNWRPFTHDAVIHLNAIDAGKAGWQSGNGHASNSFKGDGGREKGAEAENQPRDPYCSFARHRLTLMAF